MNKHLTTLCMGASLLALASCGSLGSIAGRQDTTSSSTTANSQTKQDNGASQSTLGSLLSTLVGNAVPLNEQTLIGTWKYESPDCRFESENALSQAGGAVAAATVESKLADAYAKLGIKKGACSFTFNSDKTCSVTMGGRTINGKYTLDTKNRTLNITDGTGLIRLNAMAYYDLSQLTLLFDAQKLLTVAQAVSAITGKGSSSIGALSDIIGTYKGLKLGVNLKK